MHYDGPVCFAEFENIVLRKDWDERAHVKAPSPLSLGPGFFGQDQGFFYPTWPNLVLKIGIRCHITEAEDIANSFLR